MPKGHRGGSTGLIRSHSRNSSSSKLGSNLQFTQKEQHPPKPLDKPKKNGTTHDTNQGHHKGIARVSSAQRVHSREHIQQFVLKQRAAPQSAKAQGKAGFTIASASEEDDEEGEWESSESGAATPNHNHSDSGSESDDIPDEEAIRRLTEERQAPPLRQTNGTRTGAAPLARAETPRPADFRAAAVNAPQLQSESSQQPTQPPPQPQHETRANVRTPTLPPIKTTPPRMHQPHPQNHRSLDHETDNARSPQETPSPGHPSPRIPSRRHASTRPPSSHSIRSDHPLRPHPLIRGHSYGQVLPSKPAPLEPLTVISDASTSSSASTTLFQGSELSTSPTSSIKTSPGGGERDPPHRRQSVSSSRSVATLPVHSGLRDSVNWSLGDRKRTQSTVSHTSSSAALSSLVHLPTVTRPPSPQAIAFFPPVNPHANIEGIHPLLPGPYLNNHLTVLSRRTPIKEAFDRVTRAKQVRC
ncbi:hypothetical protein H0H87_007070 [Tephrocybe sp. NHM501043]|nr:hypothetical protein H0H87_007070 [Tephrocybe sp. NHM501043]